VTEAERQWRQARLHALTVVGGLPQATALGVIEREALWRPWEFVTQRVPSLPNFDRPKQ